MYTREACSIIDTGSEDDYAASSFPEVSQQIPVQASDGSIMLFSSSTMDAKKLKEFKEQAEVMKWGLDG